MPSNPERPDYDFTLNGAKRPTSQRIARWHLTRHLDPATGQKDGFGRTIWSTCRRWVKGLAYNPHFKRADGSWRDGEVVPHVSVHSYLKTPFSSKVMRLAKDALRGADDGLVYMDGQRGKSGMHVTMAFFPPGDTPEQDQARIEAARPACVQLAEETPKHPATWLTPVGIVYNNRQVMLVFSDESWGVGKDEGYIDTSAAIGNAVPGIKVYSPEKTPEDGGLILASTIAVFGRDLSEAEMEVLEQRLGKFRPGPESEFPEMEPVLVDEILAVVHNHGGELMMSPGEVIARCQFGPALERPAAGAVAAR